MGKLLDIEITDFSAGMSDNVLDTDNRIARIIQHFDIRKNKLVPYRSHETGDSSASTNQIGKFCYANARLYGLSLASGSGTKLFEKTDYTNATWNGSTNVTSVSEVPDGKCFIEYKSQGLLFWSLLSGALASYAYGSNTYTASARAIAVTAPAIVHSKDDVAYFPCANIIATNNAGSWNNTALTLPSRFTITKLVERGNDLVIVCKTADGYSRVFIWDRDASVTTLSDTIDAGAGDMQVAGEVDGVLVGVSYVTTNALQGRTIFQQLVGNKFVPFAEFVSTVTSTVGDLLPDTQIKDNKLHFLMTVTIDGQKLQGVWSVGRPYPGAPNFAITLARLPNNDTALVSGTLNGFIFVGDYCFVSYVSNSTYGMTKTDDQANYTASSIFQTKKVRNKSPFEAMQLMKATVLTEPLPAAGTAVIKYRKDAETSFTTILTSSTDDDIRETTNNASGAALAVGHQFDFQVVSTGGAVVTGLRLIFEEIDNDA